MWFLRYRLTKGLTCHGISKDTIRTLKLLQLGLLVPPLASLRYDTEPKTLSIHKAPSSEDLLFF